MARPVIVSPDEWKSSVFFTVIFARIFYPFQRQLAFTGGFLFFRSMNFPLKPVQNQQVVN